MHRAAACIALCAAVRESGNGILSLELGMGMYRFCRTFRTEEEEQPTGFLMRCARLFW